MIRTVSLKTISLISVSVIFLAGCGLFTSAKKDAQLIIINVLDKNEFDDCHIAGSISIPFSEFEDKIQSFDKNDHYVIYCADYACMSSGYCAQLLRNVKISHVWEYSGGIVEWYQKGYPIQGPAVQEYLRGENIQMDEDKDSSESITADELLAKIEEFSSKVA